ncbi:hypothetical protein BGZ61DRAFT_468284 [Ilyonectria robusta]|uniref:uncharacterized protein n=1 Tax=Ilyonectria robusta TaxID=1079257 RepID=UPI001E8D0614|nr:uncharacterized protein BGZ61DRAFT_468284 [Ilyonectria robusta]KAH8652938.1 hypothetical protein BGZ61DRAFT_468284 [Ilyonectria robusta]
MCSVLSYLTKILQAGHATSAGCRCFPWPSGSRSPASSKGVHVRTFRCPVPIRRPP